MWCELETWMLRLYRRQMWELMGDQPLDASNVQNMVDHMNSQAIFWKHIIIWCCTSQINCLTKENNSEQCSFHFATSSHHNLQDCVSFFLDTSLLVNTIEKRTKICGRWFNGVRWHLWQGDCTWSLLTWMNARDPCGKPLTRMVWSSENFNRLIQLIESDCSYVFYVMWCVLFTLHDIWLASNECTKMHLVSSWRTSNGQLMGSCSETSQQILCSCDRMCSSDCKGEPSYDWNVLLGSTFFLGFQLSAMNQVTERWEVICSDDDGLTCSGNSSSIRRWEKNTWRHASWSCVCLEPLCRFRLHL